GHSGELEQPGDFLAVDIDGRSVLVVRQDDGGLAASLNVCRHRGCPLVDTPSSGHRANGFTCPYHGWRYGLGGELRSVPDRRRVLPDLDTGTRSLVPVPVDEAYGFVWLHPSSDASSGGRGPATLGLGSFADDLDAYGFEQYSFFRREE